MQNFLPDPSLSPTLAAAAPPGHKAPRPVLAHRPHPAAPASWLVALSRWVRRTHLYSGLLLVPFVLVYGISAFLFNHPAPREEDGRDNAPQILEVSDTLRGELPTAGALADAVAAALDSGPAEAASASLRGSWTFEFEQQGQRQRLSLAADGSSAELRAVAERAARGTRLPAETLDPASAAAMRVAEQVLAQAGCGEVRLRGQGAPQLRYRQGTTEVTTAIDRRQANVREAAALDFGRLLMRLHTAHGYSSSDAARVVWAVIVDVMAGAMVLWAVSGLWMWWQKRSYRRAGLWTLGFTGIGATALIVAMYLSMTN